MAKKRNATRDSSRIVADPSDERRKRISTIRTFTQEFLAAHQVAVQPLSSDELGGLQAVLPSELASHFGSESIQLVFRSDEAGEGRELVAQGSRIFDKMMSYLDQHSAAMVRRLPARHSDAARLLRAVQPFNAAVADLKLSEDDRPLFVFTWHITYRADDKREELYTVVVDEHQRRMPINAGPVQEPAAQSGEKPDLDLETLLADSMPLPPRLDADGAPQPAPLPPMTQLSRLAESARTYALYHADVRSIDHEAEILPRLHKALSRLTSYYQQQIEEVYDAHDPSGEKRRVLEEDLQRKIAEEVENHRLRVQVRLLSYALLYVPVARARVQLSDGQRSAEFQVVQNRYTGTLRRPVCSGCEEEIAALMLCRNGHLSCTDCSRTCATCEDSLCADCGLSICRVCEQENCEACSRFCWACGERACAEHVSACPTCGDTVCAACQEPCAACGARQCRSHLRIDGVTGALLCATCAVRCPGCHAYTVELALCAESGQRFCASCAVACASCRRTLGPGFYTTDPDSGAAFCQSCLQQCPTCGQPTTAVHEHGCHTCAQSTCTHCSRKCAVCERLLCATHAAECVECGRILCAEHLQHCTVGHEALCGRCAAVCPQCETSACAAHLSACALCRQRYCVACLKDQDLCGGCAALLVRPDADTDRLETSIVMAEEPVFHDRRVQLGWDKFTWASVQNNRYIVYLGTDAYQRNMIVVAEMAPGGSATDVDVVYVQWGRLAAPFHQGPSAS